MTEEFLKSEFGIDDKVLDFVREVENNEVIKTQFQIINEISEFNQYKVLKAMQKNNLNDTHFAATTGYGYNDLGRDTLENIYADVFKTESALVRPQLVSGTHALAVALFGNLRSGDELLSPNGLPYDTLQSVIGINGTKNSLIEHGIVYKQVDLLEKAESDEFDFENIKNAVTDKTKLVTIQRSKGYSLRHSFSVSEIKKLISFIKNINPNIICMVDNCYGEFVDYTEPSEIGADICVGSLIKNPGGGLAPVGGYIVGKEEFVENAACRLTAPGLGKEVGPTLGVTSSLIQGLFLAPQVVAGSLKTAVFASYIFDKLGFFVTPKMSEKRSDIVQCIKLNDEKTILAFCEGIQMAAPVDSFVKPVAADMPGYDAKIIMAAGAFVQGSSIELSADAPIKEPFAVYFQGALNWHHGKIGIIITINNMYKKGFLKL